ncbi:hypothetical protein BBJ28_00008822 [Nothophytophthora sp. Chile5]|nr:hypothetical protein BBJ28_00008822 [Nothophytophthora sp. Chile5]
MRMRLCAPEEPEAESSGASDNQNAGFSTPERSLPHLDVRSPEYIEERLENLKRRPAWGEYLDQYVEDHPDSDDSEDESYKELELGGLAVGETPGLLRSTIWSLLVVTFSPLLVACYPCLRRKGRGYVCLLILMGNVLFLAFGLTLLYWTICRELPDLLNVDNTLVNLDVRITDMLRAVDMCHAALLQWERTVAQELCMPIGIDGVLLLVNGWLLLHSHRRWARHGMMIMAVLFVVDLPTKLYDATFPAPEIHSIDPSFAMIDEELLVALEGKNLKPGGSVAWVAYWGCATTSDMDTCEKQFPSTFESGVVPVTFKALDHFIPCYRDPPNPLKAQEYQCFESVRIRVKDKQSIPGWSQSLARGSVVSSSAKVVDRTLTVKKVAESEVKAQRAELNAFKVSKQEDSIPSVEKQEEEGQRSSDSGGDVGSSFDSSQDAKLEELRSNRVEAKPEGEKSREIEVTLDADIPRSSEVTSEVMKTLGKSTSMSEEKPLEREGTTQHEERRRSAAKSEEAKAVEGSEVSFEGEKNGSKTEVEFEEKSPNKESTLDEQKVKDPDGELGEKKASRTAAKKAVEKSSQAKVAAEDKLLKRGVKLDETKRRNLEAKLPEVATSRNQAKTASRNENIPEADEEAITIKAKPLGEETKPRTTKQDVRQEATRREITTSQSAKAQTSGTGNAALPGSVNKKGTGPKEPKGRSGLQTKKPDHPTVATIMVNADANVAAL